MLDLGLVNQAEYYTGVIFRGYVADIGTEVLSGGRYDQLVGEFGEEQPAVGFGVNVDLISQKLPEFTETPPQVLVFAKEERFLPDAARHFQELTEQGVQAENGVFDQLSEAAEYGRRAGIPKLHIVGETVEIVPLGKEQG